ncbi:hypothetical protein TrCOL_g12979 [Triparma columacea]|uniref:HTH CENPB-type domain-containing protein n=1 Tax=Triparma columacea TaxID=722753 RepID=A0A9W7LDG7_9STRA|nr:hypothetical protein TrCOL_g12979 [Triparma columacea]
MGRKPISVTASTTHFCKGKCGDESCKKFFKNKQALSKHKTDKKKAIANAEAHMLAAEVSPANISNFFNFDSTIEKIRGFGKHRFHEETKPAVKPLFPSSAQQSERLLKRVRSQEKVPTRLPNGKIGAYKIGKRAYNDRGGNKYRARRFSMLQKNAFCLRYLLQEEEEQQGMRNYCKNMPFEHTQLCKWLIARRDNKWEEKCTKELAKQLKNRVRNNGMFPDEEAILHEEIKNMNKAGKQVTPRFMMRRMKQLVGNERMTTRNFTAGTAWLYRFCKRKQLRKRCATAKRKHTPDQIAEAGQKFMSALVQVLNERPARNAPVKDDKYGYYPLRVRYASDQVPLPLVVDQKVTYTGERGASVQIKSPGSGLEKRQCTIQMTMRAEGAQPPIAVIFRRKERSAKLMSAVEKAALEATGVEVYWQKNAWADTEMLTDDKLGWIQNSWKPILDRHHKLPNGEYEPTLHFLDNLGSQISEAFRTEMEKLNTTLMFYPANHTDNFAPPDSGTGRGTKLYFGKALDEWLEDDANFLCWSSGKSFTAPEKRILIAQLLVIAWERQQEEAAKNANKSVNKVFLRYFERTGCAITVDGSEDHLISLEKLKHYKGTDKKWTFNRDAVDSLTIREHRQATQGEPEKAADVGAAAQPGQGGLLDLLHDDTEGEINAEDEFRLLCDERDYTLSDDDVQDGSLIIGKWGSDAENGGGGWYVGKVRMTGKKWKKDIQTARNQGQTNPRVVYWDDGYETIWDRTKPITREDFNKEMSATTEADSQAPVFSWFVAQEAEAQSDTDDDMEMDEE